LNGNDEKPFLIITIELSPLTDLFYPRALYQKSGANIKNARHTKMISQNKSEGWQQIFFFKKLSYALCC
jgi:hypothetical protein